MGTGRFRIIGFLALLFSVAFFSFQVLTVDANIASIVSIDSYDIGSASWLNITVAHSFPPAIGSDHYVSVVKLEINGTVVDLPQSPQSIDPFVVEYNLGSVGDTYVVKVQPLCNLHGGYESSAVTVPEYSLLAAALIVVLVTVMVIAAKHASGKRLDVGAFEKLGLNQ